MNPSAPKIRVCHLASGDLWAGAEVQVLNSCRGLRETGVVDVSAILLNEGRLAEELQSAGMEVTVVDEEKIPSWRILWELMHYFRRHPVDVLHTHRYKENILGSVAAKMAGVPHIIRTIHGTTEGYSGLKLAKAKVYGALDEIVFRRCVSGLIGVSREISDYLERRFPGKTIVHIPNCIDERRLVPTIRREDKRLQLGLKPSAFVIGTVGRLTPVKGTEYLIRAVPEVIKHYEGVRILIVGDGPLRADLEALAQSLGLEKTVIFLGSRDDTVDILNALDLFVLPSLHEGLPTVLLEAMFLGVPVVASATGGITELVKDGWNGLLLRPQTKSLLAEKCLAIITDSSLASRLVRNAKQTARKHKASDTVASLLEFYRNLTHDTCAKRTIL